MKDIVNVLEPSCGSCEYILKLSDTNSNININGIELNKTIFESIKKYEKDNITLINDNFLTHDFKSKLFDLIIGNPPYFVMKQSEVDKSYREYYEGRPNIFVLFILKSLQLLNEGGIISFVLPQEFFKLFIL